MSRLAAPRADLRRRLKPLVDLARRLRHQRTYRLSRSLVELFRHVQEGSLVVQLQSFGGTFEIDARSHILHRVLVAGGYEPEIVALLKTLVDPGRDAIDIGANVGLYTVLISDLLFEPQKTLAVEPTPRAGRLLSLNLERNNVSKKVIVYRGAVGEAAGSITMNVIPGKEEYSSRNDLTHHAIAGERSEQIVVPCQTVDALVDLWRLKPGFMKIDVEGAERTVLAGAKKTIHEFRPVILFESWENKIPTPPDALAEFFKVEGYALSRPMAEEILAVPMERGPN